MNRHANRRKALAVLLAACTCGLGVPVPPARACCSPPPAGFSVNVTPGDPVERPCEDPHGNRCRPGDGTAPAFAGSGGSVNYFNGEEAFQQVDLAFAGIGDLVLRRTYRSQSDNDTALGYGWTLGWDWGLTRKPNGSVLLRDGSGNVYEFAYEDGVYQPPLGLPGDLEEDQATGEFEYRDKGGIRWRFDARGRLASRKDAHGNGLVFTWDSRGRMALHGVSEFVLADAEEPLVTAMKYRLTRVEEVLASAGATGRWMEFVYDESTGRLSEVRDSAGRTVRYEHDDRGNLVRFVDAAGNAYDYEYGDEADVHNLTRAERFEEGCPGCGGVTEWSFDDRDRVVEEKRFGGTISLEYGDLQTTVTITVVDDEEEVLREDEWTYEFTAHGAPTKITEPPGHERHYVRDDADRVTEELLYENRGTADEPDLVEVYRYAFSYDAAGNLVEKTVTLEGGEEITERWEYDSWHATTLHERYGSAAPDFVERTEFVYEREDDGDPETEDRPLHLAEVHHVTDVDPETRESRAWSTTAYEYDTDGNLVRTTLPDGRVLRATYERGLLTKQWYEGSPEVYVAYRYDHAGRPVEVDPGTGQPATIEYDALNRMVREIDPTGLERAYEYRRRVLDRVEVGAAGGQPGRVKVLGYQCDDCPLRLTSVTAGDGTSLGGARFDSEGHVIVRWDGDGVTERREYDYAGRLSKRSFDGGTETTYRYRPDGRLVEVRRGPDETLVERNTWDALGRLTSREDGAGATWSFEWNALDLVTRYVDRTGAATRFEYDTLGNLLRRIEPEVAGSGAAETTWQYGETGRPLTRKDADGRVTRYEYDDWGNVVRVSYYPDETSTVPTRQVELTYDHARRVKRMRDDGLAGSDVYEYDYDAAGRVVRLSSPFLGVTREYAYDRFGDLVERRAVAANGTWTWSYEYDGTGRPAKVTLSTPGGQERATTIALSAGGRLREVRLAAGAGIRFEYDQAGRIASIEHLAAAGVRGSYRYEYDARARITKRIDEGGDERTFSYDEAGRLVGVRYEDGEQESFSYDGEGNRLTRETASGTETCEYDAREELLSISGAATASYEYDAAGRTTRIERDGATTTLEYDGEGRLAAVLGDRTGRYAYDFGGRLVQAEEDGTLSRWGYEGGQPVMRIDQAGNVEEAMVDVPGLNGPIFTVEPDGSARGWLRDEQQSVTRVVDAAGQVLLVEDYGVFGTHRGGGDPPEAAAYRWGFGGHPRLLGPGIYAMGLRGVEVATGRFLSPDPVGVGRSPETAWPAYAYAGSNPVGVVDVTGMAPWSVQRALRAVGIGEQGYGGTIAATGAMLMILGIAAAAIAPLAAVGAAAIVLGVAAGVGTLLGGMLLFERGVRWWERGKTHRWMARQGATGSTDPCALALQWQSEAAMWAGDDAQFRADSAGPGDASTALGIGTSVLQDDYSGAATGFVLGQITDAAMGGAERKMQQRNEEFASGFAAHYCGCTSK